MSVYNVSVFLLHCYISVPVEIGNIIMEPFEGSGIVDVAELIDKYAERYLQQPPQPLAQKITMSQKVKESGATVVLNFLGVESENHIDAINETEDALLLCRDVIALRQMQRGTIAGFLAIQTDVSPFQLYSQVRHPYPILRKIQNIPIFDNESSILARLLNKAIKHPLLKIYLSLYADTLAYSDTLITDISIEARLLKTWSLLETMAYSESGTKKQKVKALFSRYSAPFFPNYHNHTGKDLLDIAYEWRNIIAHTGGCKTAVKNSDQIFCRDFQSDFLDILEDLSQSCRMLLHAFANSLP